MSGGGGLWGAIGEIGAAALSALGLIVAGIVAARATASAARTSTQAQEALETARTTTPPTASRELGDCEGLVRALARAYDELRFWARNPEGPPPEPNERVRRFYDTGA